MRGGDTDAENDVRELRGLLKSAQNDVKRYAAHVIRLQLELDRERLKAKQATGDERERGDNEADESGAVVSAELREHEVESTQQRSRLVEESLERLLLAATSDCDACHCQQNHRPGGVAGSEAETRFVRQLEDAKAAVVAQKQQIESLARENAKLRDTLSKRPTNRDLARSQWQIDSLQTQISRMKEDQRPIELDATSVPVFDAPPHDSLADRISVDKLLSWLHVETRQVKHAGGRDSTTKQGQFSRRRFLKEPIECYLVLDSAALDGPTPTGSSMTENEKMKRREQLSRRVGILCSEIVASCCHSVGVYKIAKLPRYVEATYQYAQLVPHLQEFVHRVDGYTQAAAVIGDSHARKARHEFTPANAEGFLSSLSSRVQDLVLEVRARREQMKPPGERALAVMLRCMKILQVNHIADLAPTLETLLDATRREKEFSLDVRKLLGLDVAASRVDTLHMLKQLLEQLGLWMPSSPSARTARPGGFTRSHQATTRHGG